MIKENINHVHFSVTIPNLNSTIGVECEYDGMELIQDEEIEKISGRGTTWDIHRGDDGVIIDFYVPDKSLELISLFDEDYEISKVNLIVRHKGAICQYHVNNDIYEVDKYVEIDVPDNQKIALNLISESLNDESDELMKEILNIISTNENLVDSLCAIASVEI